MKYNYKKMLCLCSVLLLSNGMYGCKTTVEAVSANTTTETTAVSETAASLSVEYKEEDLNSTWTKTNATSITLKDTAIEINGAGATAANNILTISDAGMYIISGSLVNGQIIVDAEKTDTIRLVLNGASIQCTNSAPIYIKQADKTIITVADGTENVIQDGAAYTFEDETSSEPNAAIFSKDDLTFNGNGVLKVTGNYNNGIQSKDDLVIISGTYEITSANHGIKGKDSVAIKDGTFYITSGGDAIQSDNTTDTTKGWISIDDGTFDLTSENDGIQAETILQINQGTYHIVTGGGSVNQVKKDTAQDRPFGQRPPNGEMPVRENGEMPMRENAENNSDTASAPPKMNIEETGELPPTPPDMEETGELPPTPPDRQAQENNEASVSSTDTTAEETISTKALKGGSSIYITDGTFSIDACDDSIHSNGNIMVKGGDFTIATGDDGFHADNSLVIDGGTITITESYEGLEGANITIQNGSIALTASDDGVNAAGGSDNTAMNAPLGHGDQFSASSDYFIRISGGILSVNASGDGIDSNGNVYIDGGTVLVNGPTNHGDSALDFDGECIISGGIVAAAGSAGMAQAPSTASTQNTIQITYTQAQTANTLVHLSDSNGKTIFAFAPQKDYQSIIISTPEIKLNESCQLSTGGSCDGTNTFHLYTTGNYTSGTKLTEITPSTVITSIDETGSTVTTNAGGFRGGRGGGKHMPQEQTATQ